MIESGRKDGESFFERLNQLWEKQGVKPGEWGFRSAWVMKFGKFIAPKRFYQAELSDVELFTDGWLVKVAITGSLNRPMRR
ncbi:MAG: hypothetical protein HC904_00250 [Blastochloris sp.]|nr:hypothetical protein [Blastochloris sp.]